MRSLSSLVLVASSSLLLACSLDTEQFAFTGVAGAPGVGGSSGAPSGGASGAPLGGASGAPSGGASGAPLGGAAGSGGDTAGAAGSGVAGEAGAGGANEGGAAGAAAGGASGAAAGEGGTSQGGGAGEGGAAGGGGSSTTTCTQDATRCSQDGKTIETCIADVWTPDPAPCGVECVQKNAVIAICAECAVGDKSCAGDLLQVCKTDRTGFTAVDCSATSKICDPGLKACVTCSPNAIVCASGVAFVCDAEGSINPLTGTNCGSPTLCEPGTATTAGCKVAACKAGEFKCATGQIENCLPDGTAFDVAQPCPGATEMCFDGVGCAECNEPSGAVYCLGDNSSSCVNGNLETLAACPAGQCDVSKGTCKTCTPGSVQCSADAKSIATCPADGLGFPPATPCPGSQLCDQAEGKCVACRPGEFSCVGDELFVCKGDASGTKSAGQCGVDLCDAEQGRCDECKAGDKTCDGADVMGCDANGSIVRVDTCATSDLCKDGQCLDPVCDVGELKCKPEGQLTVCNAARNGYDSKGTCDHGCLDKVGCVTAVDLFSGPNATCAIVDGKSEFRVPVCWGKSIAGLLVDAGGNIDVPPQRIKELSEVAKMAISGTYACALSTKGQVSCWGANANYQLGQGNVTPQITPTTVNIPGTGEVTDIASMNSGICVVKGGAIYCWGSSPANGIGPIQTPTQLQGIDDAVAVRLGGNHRCYVNSKGETRCLGYHDKGQLGNGKSFLPAGVFVPAGDPVAGEKGGSALQEMSGLSTGTSHSCSLLPAGAAVCWGNNEFGQLGIDPSPMTPPALPFATKGAVDNLSQIAASKDFTCGVNSESTVLCWGQAGDQQTGGELGAKFSFGPAKIAGSTATKIALGEKHGCLLNDSGDVYCWGANNFAQLGQPQAALPGSGPAVPVAYPLIPAMP